MCSLTTELTCVAGLPSRDFLLHLSLYLGAQMWWLVFSGCRSRFPLYVKDLQVAAVHGADLTLRPRPHSTPQNM